MVGGWVISRPLGLPNHIKDFDGQNPLQPYLWDRSYNHSWSWAPISKSGKSWCGKQLWMTQDKFELARGSSGACCYEDDHLLMKSRLLPQHSSLGQVFQSGGLSFKTSQCILADSSRNTLPKLGGTISCEGIHSTWYLLPDATGWHPIPRLWNSKNLWIYYQ